MKARKRLTRQESKEMTRMRLIEAAETLFIRKGFDDTSVEEISEMAGYSRGAFYSNFDDKEQVFMAVMTAAVPRSPARSKPFSSVYPSQPSVSPPYVTGSRMSGG